MVNLVNASTRTVKVCCASEDVNSRAATSLRNNVDAVICLRHLVLDKDTVAHNSGHAVNAQRAVSVCRKRCANAAGAVVVGVGGQSRNSCQPHSLVEVNAGCDGISICLIDDVGATGGRGSNCARGKRN